MSNHNQDIDPEVLALPDEGKREYLRWGGTFNRLTMTCLASVDKLKEIIRLDPGRSTLYEWKINELLREASETMEEWQEHRRRILDKWSGKR